MASPISLYIVPNCCLKIKFDKDPKERFGNWKTSQKTRSLKEPLEYEIVKDSIPSRYIPEDFVPPESKKPNDYFSGVCSPMSPVTLPEAIKNVTGIPLTAAYFCYLHPPPALARTINWRTFKSEREKAFKNDEQGECDEQYKIPVDEENDWAIPFIALLGGYVYFDDHFDIIRINALSLMATNYDFKLSGPFLPTDAATEDIRRSKRARAVPLDYFYEVGFVAYAWIRPKEKFFHKNAIKNVDNDYVQNDHGSVLFYREDGSAILYALDPTGYINPVGEHCTLSDVFDSTRQTVKKSGNKEDIGFLVGYKFPTEAEVRETCKKIEQISGPEQKQSCLKSLDLLPKALIHEACKVGCSIDTIKRLLDDKEVLNLDYRDKFGSTPLHYACRHQPENHALIHLLIQKCSKAVVLKDRVNRYPLHIACDSKASANVIAALVDADKEKIAILQKTKFGEKLPIHIACYKKLSKESIDCLLKADPSSKALRTKSKHDRLPLHMAIEQRLPTEVIQLLLDAERNARQHHTEIMVERRSAIMQHTSHASIYVRYQDMLPLHLACWKNSPKETVEALLNEDKANTTVIDIVGESSFLSQRDLGDDNFSSHQDSHHTYSIETEGLNKNEDELTTRIYPLHLAAKHGSPEIISLLLEKEKEIEKTKERNRLDSSIYSSDWEGLIPLHIACRYCDDPRIIEELLEMDENGETTQQDDEWENKPIHYACNKKNASGEIVRLLLEAEERYIEYEKGRGGDIPKRSTHTCEGKSGSSPLFLAVKAGAPESVIQILLRSEHFFLKGFDYENICRLSSMAVDNRIVQDCMMEKLSERCYFYILCTDVYMIVCALVCFLVGSEKLIAGERSIIEPLILFFIAAILGVRELILVKSQGTQYFTDGWNLLRVPSIALVARSARHMIEEVGNPDPDPKKALLITSGILIIIQLSFFLRATFLPFARFVGGFISIFSTLVPFFIIANLLLLTFAYGFFIQGNEPKCSDILNCYVWTLNAFFSGSEETDDMLDIAFGFIAIVVLLNVVIAIVSESWSSVQHRAIQIFWRFRLEFLCQSRFFANFSKKLYEGGSLERLGGYIDSFREPKFADRTPWSEEPFNIVTSKEQYDHPYKHFNPRIAKQVFDAKSLQGDLYWTRMDIKNEQRLKNEQRKCACRSGLYLIIFCKWAATGALHALLFLFGFFTAGLLWPKSLRKRVLTVGLGVQEEKASALSKA